MDWVIEIVMGFLLNNPHMAVVLTFISVSRLMFKPICSLIQTYVDATPSLEDNAKWEALKKSKALKAAVYLLDLFASVKIPVKK